MNMGHDYSVRKIAGYELGSWGSNLDQGIEILPLSTLFLGAHPATHGVLRAVSLGVKWPY
jgi:hypothetical protein